VESGRVEVTGLMGYPYPLALEDEHGILIMYYVFPVAQIGLTSKTLFPPEDYPTEIKFHHET